jgi:hypothetical protein
MILFGCSKKADVKGQISELEKAFPGTTGTSTQATAAAKIPTGADAYVQSALAAVRQNDYAASVIALEQAQRARGVSAQQMMAVERAKAALTAALLARADRGDAQAQAALAAIEKTHSQ